MYSPMIPRAIIWIEPMNSTTPMVLAQPRGAVRLARASRRTQPISSTDTADVAMPR